MLRRVVCWLQDLLTHALSKPWTCQQLEVLNEMNGAETVVQAVTRVNQLTSARSLTPSDSRPVSREGPASQEGQAELGSEPSGGSMAGFVPVAEAGDGSEAAVTRSAASTTSYAALSAAGSLQPVVTGRTLSLLSAAPTLGALGTASFTTMAQRWTPPSPLDVLAELDAQAASRGSSQAQQTQDGSSPIRKLNPLPPPPASKGDTVVWEEWNPISALQTGGRERAMGSWVLNWQPRTSGPPAWAYLSTQPACP